MGLFSKIFGKGTKDSDVAIQQVSPKTMGTETVCTSNVIDMSKSKENLNKVLINMSKDSKINMSKHVARVALVMDYSGSMEPLYDNDSVQKVITRLLPIALKFDDNGELESWLFSDYFEKLNAVTIKNYEDYVKKVMRKADLYMGSTYYAPVLNDVVKYYKDIEPSEVPAFIIFITDGDNYDKSATNEIVKELSNYNIFVQFIGIGKAKFNYLKSLDDMKGRKHDNTGFTAVKDMNKMTDEELYIEILRQYKDWLNNK